jgi:hypothetical protein
MCFKSDQADLRMNDFSMSVWEMHIDILGHGTRDLDLSNPSTGNLDW